MSVFVLEAKDCASPLFLVRMWALLCGCLTFSLVATLESGQFRKTTRGEAFWVTCMFTWCFFFILTLLIHVLNAIRFHSLLPVSWKNLTITTAAMGALMTLSASVLYFWLIMDCQDQCVRSLVAAIASCLTVLAYCSEVWVIRRQSGEQRGYMASLAGCFKIIQCWGGCQTIPLFVVRMAAEAESREEECAWQLWLSVGLYNVCLLVSLASIMVILCDCAGRCPFPFHRLLAGFSLLGVLFYMVAVVLCVANVLQLRKRLNIAVNRRLELAVLETVIVCITLLSYTVDFSLSIKQLRERGQG